jgi:hypothetical protein
MYWRGDMIVHRNKLPKKALNSFDLKSAAYSSHRRAVLQPASPNRTKLMVESEHARSRAEAAFKQKEDARGGGLKASEEYEAGQRATREKTARLRALRLARDQAKK